jgi:RNA polymerase sigma-70 factor, ECF subfamily
VSGVRTGEDRSARFEVFYCARYQEIAGYIRRRVVQSEADDVVAQVFTVAWRRFDQVPVQPGDRLWLFGVARRCVADHDRSRHRRLRLGARLASDATGDGHPSSSSDPRFDHVLDAMSTLRPSEREALQLVLWDDLTHAEAAALVGCSVNAFELRYRRARNSVRDAVAGGQARSQPDPTPGIRTSAPARGNAS